MSSLYQRVSIPAAKLRQEQVTSRMYKGFSTVSSDTNNYKLYDLALVKQDLMNNFYVRQGERLMQPTFGTIIWDLLFEPMTDNVRRLIEEDVTTIVNYDPRISVIEVRVSAYNVDSVPTKESKYTNGIQIDCILRYNVYNIVESMQLRFDQDNGFLAQ